LASGGSLSAAQFLQLFLFDPEKHYTPLSLLSGGEKRRLHLLSILFRNPNFLILDEPTNDLDLPTLGVLENFLSEFQGCLVVVSHDRYFMDRLVDHLFVFEGDGIIKDFPGNYSLYRESARDSNQTSPNEEVTQAAKEESLPVKKSQKESAGKRSPSFKEKREFEQLQKEIDELNIEKATITERLNSKNTPYQDLQDLSIRIGVVNQLIDEKELRWLELSEII